MLQAILLAAAAPYAGASAPAQPYATKWPAPEPWMVDERGLTCIAGQVLPEEQTQAAVFVKVGGSVELIILSPNAPLKRKEMASVDLRLDGTVLAGVKAYGVQVNPVQKGISAELDKSILKGLAAASRLLVMRDGKEVLAVDLRNSARALAQLNRCIASIAVPPPLITVVPPAPPPIIRRSPSPVQVVNTWVDESDYPGRAIRAGAQGNAQASVDVDEKGEPSNCMIVKSSGNPDLDFATCVLMEDRFAYLPALDAQGHTYASKATKTLVWKLPAETPPPAEPASASK